MIAPGERRQQTSQMHKLFYFIAHNRHFSAMAALIIIVYGLIAMDNATISRDPDYAIPVVSVNLLNPRVFRA